MWEFLILFYLLKHVSIIACISVCCQASITNALYLGHEASTWVYLFHIGSHSLYISCAAQNFKFEIPMNLRFIIWPNNRTGLFVNYECDEWRDLNSTQIHKSLFRFLEEYTGELERLHSSRTLACRQLAPDWPISIFGTPYGLPTSEGRFLSAKTRSGP